VHAAHNLFVHTGAQPNREEIVRFGRMVPKPDLLVWVTAPPSQSAEVIRRRGHSRVRGPDAAALAFAENAPTTFAGLCTVEGVRERICKVDNSANGTGRSDTIIRARAADLGAFLKRHAQQCREAGGAAALTCPTTLN